MQRTTRVAMGLALSLCACVISPREEQMVFTAKPLQFSGLASQPASTIIVEALDLSTNQWEPIGTTTTLGDAWSLGGHAFYYFDVSITMQSVPDWQCYYAASCDLSDDGCRDIRFRVREPGGLTNELFTYTEASYDCTVDLVIDELEDAYEAYATCNPGLPHEIVARSCFIG